MIPKNALLLKERCHLCIGRQLWSPQVRRRTKDHLRGFGINVVVDNAPSNTKKILVEQTSTTSQSIQCVS
uniref:Transposase n=1 Tax=Caenorhabditis tropicalis TaxID=1561998 RepID=A0A1I7USP0_9PELO